MLPTERCRAKRAAVASRRATNLATHASPSITQLKTSIHLPSLSHILHSYKNPLTFPYTLHLLSAITKLLDFVRNTHPCAGYIEEIRKKSQFGKKFACVPPGKTTGLLIQYSMLIWIYFSGHHGRDYQYLALMEA